MLEITEEEPIMRRNSDTMRQLYKKIDKLKSHSKRSEFVTRSRSSSSNKMGLYYMAIYVSFPLRHTATATPDKVISTSATPSIRSNYTKSTVTDISLRKKTFEIDFVGLFIQLIVL